MIKNWFVHLFYSWWNMSDYHWYPESSWWPMWILRFLWERMQNVKSYYLKVRSNKKYLLIPHVISRFCHFTWFNLYFLPRFNHYGLCLVIYFHFFLAMRYHLLPEQRSSLSTQRTTTRKPDGMKPYVFAIGNLTLF